MLAMFEAKKEETSPPSRGRSPALSVSDATGYGSRPISKVRASFVAVERSGQMGSMVGLRKASDVENGSPRAPSLGAESKTTALEESAAMDTPTNKLKGVKEEENSGDAKGPPARPQFGGRNKSTQGKTGNGATVGNGGESSNVDLGTVLKGSPFESDSATTEHPETPRATAAAGKNSGSSTSTKPLSSQAKATAKKFGESASATSPAASTTKQKPSRPSAISTRTASSSVRPGPQSAKSNKSDKYCTGEDSFAKTASERSTKCQRKLEGACSPCFEIE
jgi:hypothetical protein